jgi:hypothetical protein
MGRDENGDKKPPKISLEDCGTDINLCIDGQTIGFFQWACVAGKDVNFVIHRRTLSQMGITVKEWEV